VNTTPPVAGGLTFSQTMLPTQEELDEYVASVTEYVHSIPGQVQHLYDKLVSDIQRHGPWPPVVTVPGLGSFEVPVPSPPLELPKEPIPWYQLGFIEDDDTRRIVGIAGVAGVGLGLGLGMWKFYRMKDAKRKRKESLDKNRVRREVVGKSWIYVAPSRSADYRLLDSS
jgi:hypothetical protein